MHPPRTIFGVAPAPLALALAVHGGLFLLAVVLGASSDRKGGELRSVVVSVAPAPTHAAPPDEPVEEFDLVEETPVEEPTALFESAVDEAPAAVVDERPPTDDADSQPNVDQFKRLPSESLGGPPRVASAPTALATDEEQTPIEEAEPAPPVREEEPTPPPGLDPSSQAPQLLECPSPTYPRLAVQRRWEGTVLLRLELGTDGRVLVATVESTSGHAVLDDAARTTVLQSWRYVSGEAGRVVLHRITFDLDG